MVDTTGEVIAIDGDMAKVKFLRTAACKNCGACISFSDNELIVDIKNTLNANVGDRVSIVLHSSGVVKAALIMYGIPLVALIVFMFVGSAFGEIWSALLGIAAAVISYVILHMLEPVFARMGEFNPRMIKLLSDNNEGEQ